MSANMLLLEYSPNLDTGTFDIKSLLSSPQVFNQVKPDDTLDTALTNVESSHEPVLIFNSKHFQGLVALGNVLYQSKYPHSAKVKRVMMNPPKLSLESDFFEIAEAMYATKIYALPVFSDDSVVGIIELATLLKWLASKPENLTTLAEAISLKEPITIDRSATVHEAMGMFKSNGVSRLIVVYDNGSLEGILTRNHLRKTFFSPSNRQRFSKTEDPSSHVFDPAEVSKRGDGPISRLYQTNVFTGRSSGPMEMILQSLIDSNYNSVVIVDENQKPVGFLSNRNILQGLMNLKPVV